MVQFSVKNNIIAGLNGNPTVVEVGGPGYLLPLANRSRIYDLKDIARFTKVNNAFIIGATSGPFPYVGVNSEVSNFNSIGHKIPKSFR